MERGCGRENKSSSKEQELDPPKYELPRDGMISSFFTFCKTNAGVKNPAKKRGLKNSSNKA